MNNVIKTVKFRDLSVKDTKLKNELLKIFEDVLSSGQLILGQQVELFEKKIADYCKAKYAIGVSNGTSALYLALKASDIGFGDEVITTPFSWTATLNAIVMTGATPVFADIDENFNIKSSEIENKINTKTKAIVPVHYAGKLCEMSELKKICDSYQLKLIEDAAQAFGAYDKLKNCFAGNFGYAGAFSLNPMKVLNSYGDAGVVITNEKKVYDKIKKLRYLGAINQNPCEFVELNHKIDSLHAALILNSFKYLNTNITKRRKIAEFYNLCLNKYVTCPKILKHEHVVFEYIIRSDKRDELEKYLISHGIECKVRYRYLMPEQPAYRYLNFKSLKNANIIKNQVLSLPCHEKMTKRDTNYVVNKIINFFN